MRTPHADTSLYPIPKGSDEEALVLLSDIFSTGFECGVLNCQVKPGDTVAIVGAGPIGLAALLTAQFYSPAEIIMIDLDGNQLSVARKFGATQLVNSSGGGAVERAKELTNGKGVDVAIEAVGVPATFDICQSIVGPGGRIAVVGVHGKSVELHLEKLWSHNIALTTRLVDTVTTPMLLKTVQSGKLEPQHLITHHFLLSDIMQAYDTFGNAAKEKALKVILSNEYANPWDCGRASVHPSGGLIPGRVNSSATLTIEQAARRVSQLFSTKYLLTLPDGFRPQNLPVCSRGTPASC